LDEIAKHMSGLASSLSETQLEKLVELIVGSKRVFAYGAGRSGLMIKAFVQRLNHIAIPAFFVGDTFTPSFGRGDILVAISGSGKTESTACLVKKAKEMGGVVVVLTAHKQSRIGEMADHVVSIPGKTRLVEKSSSAPFTSLFDIAALSTLDSVVAEVMKRKGVTEEVILRLHATLE